MGGGGDIDEMAVIEDLGFSDVCAHSVTRM